MKQMLGAMFVFGLMTTSQGHDADEPATLKRETEEYHSKLLGLQKNYDQKARELFGRHLLRLESLQKSRTKRGDLEGALSLKARVTELDKQGPPLISIVRSKPTQAMLSQIRGTWVFTYTNHTQHIRRIGKEGTPGTNAKLILKNGDVLLIVGNVIERITITKDRLLVEHFNPKSLYPTRMPTVMGIGRRKK